MRQTSSTGTYLNLFSYDGEYDVFIIFHELNRPSLKLRWKIEEDLEPVCREFCGDKRKLRDKVEAYMDRLVDSERLEGYQVIVK